MARVGNQNNIFSTTGSALFAWRSVLVSAGWSSISDSDGTTYNAAGTQITHGGSGANGFANTRAWCRLRDPGGRREITLQNVATGNMNAGSWRFKMSESAGFVNGSPAATVTPSATADEQVLAGGGTDASPTGINMASTTTLRLHIVAETSGVGGVYPFQIEGVTVGSATQSGIQVFCEAMAPGSYDSLDVSPCVWYAANSTFSGTASGWIAYGTGSQAWSTGMTAASGIYNGAMGVDPLNSKDVNGFMQWSYTLTATTRAKGIGTNIAAKGPPRTHPATANLASATSFFYLGNYCYMNTTGTVPSVS